MDIQNWPIDKILALPYKLWFVCDSESGTYTAGIEEFPGCLTEGDSLEDAHSMLMDAAESWLTAVKELGQEVPEPKALEAKPNLKAISRTVNWHTEEVNTLRQDMLAVQNRVSQLETRINEIENGRGK